MIKSDQESLVWCKKESLATIIVLVWTTKKMYQLTYSYRKTEWISYVTNRYLKLRIKKSFKSNSILISQNTYQYFN